MAEIELCCERPANETAVKLTAEGFGQPLSENFAADAVAVLDNCDGFVTAADDEGTLGYIGYRMHEVKNKKIVYASTIMVDGARQGHGIAGELIRRAAEINATDLVGFRTQSARMYAAAKKIFSHLQPDIETFISGQETEHDELWQLGEGLARQRKLFTFPIAHGAYGARPMYSSRQDHPRFPQFYEIINFEAGDAMFCIGQI